MKNTLNPKGALRSFARSIMMQAEALSRRPRRMLSPVNRRSTATRLAELRRYVSKLCRIDPVFVASNRKDFMEGSVHLHAKLAQRCAELVRIHPSATFHLRRFCLCCNEMMPMLVDYQFGGVDEDGRRVPNWRERLVCPGCGMNNRQRLVAKLVQQWAGQRESTSIYLMEQVTPIFDWVSKLDAVEVHGSEYLGHEYEGGACVQGLRHEDVMRLSFPDGSFDLIVSNDVLEHIPDPGKAFQECLRVLRPGGAVLATFPFHPASGTTKVRARVVGGEVEHLQTPQYHGNPVSADGSLVFQDFGWDLLDTIRLTGFDDVQCEFYESDEFGHLGPGLLVFRSTKPGPASAA